MAGTKIPDTGKTRVELTQEFLSHETSGQSVDEMINMLPGVWAKIALFNPVVYLISGFRWSLYGISDVSMGISVGMTMVFMALCMATIAWIFKTGYRLKT